MKITFVRGQSTKNKIRFEEQPEAGKPQIIGTLYVVKWFAGDRQQIVLELEDNLTI